MHSTDFIVLLCIGAAWTLYGVVAAKNWRDRLRAFLPLATALECLFAFVVMSSSSTILHWAFRTASGAFAAVFGWFTWREIRKDVESFRNADDEARKETLQIVAAVMTALLIGILLLIWYYHS